jgi:hypothetical protein
MRNVCWYGELLVLNNNLPELIIDVTLVKNAISRRYGK